MNALADRDVRLTFFMRDTHLYGFRSGNRHCRCRLVAWRRLNIFMIDFGALLPSFPVTL